MALKDEKINQRWEVLIESGSGQTEAIFDTVTKALEKAEPPEVAWERRDIRAGGLITGRVYDFLYVTNRRLKDFRVYVTAYDYGTSLHVAWFSTIEPGFIKWLLSTLLFWKSYDPAKELSLRMDIPKQLAASAYLTTVHRAVTGAARLLSEQLEQDFSKVDTRSKGFLELW